MRDKIVRWMGISLLIAIIITFLSTLYIGTTSNTDVTAIQQKKILELSLWHFQSENEAEKDILLPTIIELDEEAMSITLTTQLPNE